MWLVVSLPVFALGMRAGDPIAGRTMIGTAKLSVLLCKLLILAQLSGLVWFVINKTHNPIKAQLLISPCGHDNGDVYSDARSHRPARR